MDFESLRELLTNWAGRLVRWSRIASADSKGRAAVEGRTIPGGPEPPTIAARLMFPFGLRSVPPAGVDAAVVHAAGGSARGMVVGCDSSRFGPSDLDGGETAVYSQQNPRALVADKAGNTKITSTTVNGTPGDVVVNGGSKPVVLDGDTVDCGHLIFIPNAGAAPASLAYLGPGVPLPNPLPAGAVALAITGKVSGSSPHFKG